MGLWPQEEHPLPRELRHCCAGDIEHLLSNVTFYSTTRPLPGHDPEPMAPRPWPWTSSPRPGRALSAPSNSPTADCVRAACSRGGGFPPLSSIHVLETLDVFELVD